MNKTISKKLTEFKNYGIALSNDEKRGDVLNWAGWNISAIREVPVSEITKENAILFLTVLLEKAKDLELISDYNTQHGNAPGVYNIHVGLKISGKRQDLGVVYFDSKTKPPIECFNLAIDILLKHFHLCDVNEKKIFTNNRISTKVIRQIYKAVKRARGKHPVFRPNIHEAYTVLCSEVGEIGTAILRETPKRVTEECYDAIAVLIRILEGDHLKKKIGGYEVDKIFVDEAPFRSLYDPLFQRRSAFHNKVLKYRDILFKQGRVLTLVRISLKTAQSLGVGRGVSFAAFNISIDDSVSYEKMKLETKPMVQTC